MLIYLLKLTVISQASFLEIYNEEIRDLLNNDPSLKYEIKMVKDEGKGSDMHVTNLKTEEVTNEDQIEVMIKKARKNRAWAKTLCNERSSRSHSIFMLKIEGTNTKTGETCCGTLNLVDLAGSENIGRSGAMDKRAREAGNINQSLLTLGRVITCLVDRAPHIPYRESKLTRLLQDSLGGRTKTSIIATISPAGINLEETLSTLDYAHRAKNIQNKPEVNQKMSKSAKLKEYTHEMERLRKDLMAAREKNGVFIAHDNYQNMLNNIEATNQELADKANTLKAMEEEMAKMEVMFEEVSAELVEKEAELGCKTTKLEETEQVLQETQDDLQKTCVEKEEQTHLVEKYVETETALKDQAKTLMETVDLSNKDLTNLHNKLDRLKSVENFNEDSKKSFHEVFQVAVRNIVQKLENYEKGHEESCEILQTEIKSKLLARIEGFNGIEETIQKLLRDQFMEMDKLEESRKEISEEVVTFLASQEEEYSNFVRTQKTEVENFEQAKLDPVLLNVAKALKVQIEELETLKSTISSDLQKVTKTVNGFSVFIVDKISQLKSSVDKYAVYNEEKIKTVETKNKEILESENRFKGLLGQLMESYTAHSKLVSDHTKQMEAVTSDDLKEVRGLMAESQETVQSATEAKEEAMNSIEEESNRIVEYSKAATERICEFNQQVEKHGKEIEEVVKDHVSSSLEALEKSEVKIKTSYEAHGQLHAQKLEELKEKLEINKTKFNHVGSSVRESLEVIQTKDGEDTALLKEKIGRVREKTNGVVVEVREEAVEESKTVCRFLREDLKQDVPTGLTPARVERSYPRALAATSPQQTILSRSVQSTHFSTHNCLTFSPSGSVFRPSWPPPPSWLWTTRTTPASLRAPAVRRERSAQTQWEVRGTDLLM